MTDVHDLEPLKRSAALKAVEGVRDGQVVGLGTGSTARYVVLALGERVRAGLRIQAVPTSRETAVLATQAGIVLLADDAPWALDLAIDGTDQVDPQMNLIKGGGGALLREKIVAAAARELIIVADHTKTVSVLGGPTPLPVEVIPFGWRATARHLEQTGGRAVLRERQGQVFVTDAGHYIVDLYLSKIEDPASLEIRLNQIPGVVECGLFVGRTTTLILGTPQGVQVQTKAGSPRVAGR
ncbi:MAG: ribose-5-phosphate isomerase RpiA [Nitrospirales bacterium]